MASGPAMAACRADRVELRGSGGVARFSVEIADDAAERAQGLMWRETMATGAGMLFVYERAQPRIAFWMKNTLIPLDILFLDASGTVRSVAANAVPGDETDLPGAPGSQFVLEINGGLAARMGLGPGTVMRSPYLDQSAAAWPCTD
ncbi:DUF192 domain-containing protein [Pseudooceanicola sp. CBS1P-1]|uniref:DUF192 domain-containing protein n=2 Tax=Paracoccaceae TaxID=31989 RepID=A0A6L7G948_9RHOB|nr:DUF192 domain-containing protein [Pseudooceanicola endophyticus]MXN20611.1 DUF192 domain-containing protein [Pseudooceanicola albus]